MANEVDWVAAAIAKAAKSVATVPGAIWTQVEALLKGKLRDQPLTTKELAASAKALMANMAPGKDEGRK